MNALHVVYIPFTGVGINNGFRGQEWFDYRIGIFKKYTLPSLINQTNKNFVLWLSFRPEEHTNPSIYRLMKQVRCIATFSGLMYYDDRVESCYNKNGKLQDRIADAMLYLSKELPPTDRILLTRLDSDDMLHKHAINDIQTAIAAEAYTFQKGYIFNSMTGELAYWNPDTNPPFHTIAFTADEFFSSEKHLAKYKDFKSHEDIPRIFADIKLGDGKYCVVTHGKHISTSWEHRFRGDIIQDTTQILKDFGIYEESNLPVS